ncbi:MAG: M23 family metallopeptidase [Treponema sp.]|nr:M23 family metallopeptidase [Treponema sp.]
MKSHGTNRIEKISLAALVLALSCSMYADTTHVVQKGETLYSLSRQYKTTVADICKANNIADGSSVKAGQKLVIPEAGKASEAKPSVKTSTGSNPAPSQTKEHVVQKGETWYGISRTYGIAVADLQAANKADASSVLKAGQKLTIPLGASIASAVAKSASSAAAAKTAPVTAASAKPDVPDLKSNDPRSYSAKKGDSSLVWPVKSPSVTYVNGKVSGVNLSARKNESVTAIREGTVMFSGLYRGFGNVVFVQSKTGHIYAYTGLGSVRVNKGEYITYGQQLGTAGVDAISEKPQVSLMVFQNGLPIDPAKAPRG